MICGPCPQRQEKFLPEANQLFITVNTRGLIFFTLRVMFIKYGKAVEPRNKKETP